MPNDRSYRYDDDNEDDPVTDALADKILDHDEDLEEAEAEATRERAQKDEDEEEEEHEAHDQQMRFRRMESMAAEPVAVFDLGPNRLFGEMSLFTGHHMEARAT